MASQWIFQLLVIIPVLVLQVSAHASTDRPYTPYKRSEWKHWTDADQDCQYTRAEVLIRDSRSQVQFKTNKGCKVVGGKWYGLYSEKEMHSATQIHIDHMLPLKLAHEYGGWRWTREQKQAYANDMDNLVVSYSSVNREKSAKGPSQWLPPHPSFHCTYARRWLHIIHKYDLQPHRADQRILEEILDGC